MSNDDIQINIDMDEEIVDTVSNNNSSSVVSEIEDESNIQVDTELVNKAVQSMTVQLTDEEKTVIEKKKKGRGKKTVDTVDADKPSIDWSKNTLSAEDISKVQLEIYDDLAKMLQDKAGLGVSDGAIDYIPTGIDIFDSILGGGIGVGTMTLFVGNPGTFKSAICGQLIGNAQKKYNGVMTANYLDTESSMSAKRLYSLGVKYPPIKPDDDDISVEKVFKILETIIVYKELRGLKHIPSIVIWDSIANTITDVEKTDPTLDVNKTIGLKARILSAVLPRYIQRLRDNNISLIAINQLREKISMSAYSKQPSDLRWMGEKGMPGGNALKYNAFHLVHLRVLGDLPPKYNELFRGVMVEAKCIKNKLFAPNIPIKLIINFNSGISNLFTNFEFLIEHGYVNPAGWNSLKGYADKFRLADLEDLYNKNEEFKKSFDNSVAECIKEKIIVPNTMITPDLD